MHTSLILKIIKVSLTVYDRPIHERVHLWPWALLWINTAENRKCPTVLRKCLLIEL
jgi:hypothetical protein